MKSYLTEITEQEPLAFLAVAAVLGLAAIVAAAATMTHIFGPKRTAHDVLSECVVRSPVMHGGVTFVCEVKR